MLEFFSESAAPAQAFGRSIVTVVVHSFSLSSPLSSPPRFPSPPPPRSPTWACLARTPNPSTPCGKTSPSKRTLVSRRGKRTHTLTYPINHTRLQDCDPSPPKGCVRRRGVSAEGSAVGRHSQRAVGHHLQPHGPGLLTPALELVHSRTWPHSYSHPHPHSHSTHSLYPLALSTLSL